MRFFAIASLVFAAATSVFAGPVAQRDSTPKGVATILTNLNSQVSTYTNQLRAFATEQVTADDIKPAVDNIRSAVKSAITELQGLQGQAVSVIMASADGNGTASPSDIATLLGDTVEDILGAVGEILSAVTGDVIPAVVDLLTALGEIVSDLLYAVGLLVTGILDLVSAVLEGLADVINGLGLTELYEQTLGYSI